MTANDNRPPRRPGEPGTRGTVAALVAVVVIGLALFWAVSSIRAHDAVQNCIDAGRHDCVGAAPVRPRVEVATLGRGSP